MRSLNTMWAVLLLAGCATTLTPNQERALKITAAFVVAGAIAAHQMDNGGGSASGRMQIPSSPCAIDPSRCH